MYILPNTRFEDGVYVAIAISR